MLGLSKSLFSLLFFIMTLISLPSIQSQPTNYIVLAMNGNALVSDYVSELFGNKTFKKGVSVSSSFNTNYIYGDIRNPVIADVAKLNGDTGTDMLSLQGIFRNGDYMSVKDYYINYTQANNKYYSNIQSSTFDPILAEDYSMGCSYKSKDVVCEGHTSEAIQVTSLGSYSYMTFAIRKNQPGVDLLKYNNKTLTIEPLDNYLDDTLPEFKFNTTYYTNLWVIDQPYLTEAYLVTQQNSTKSLLFFQINIESEENFTLSFHSRMNYNNFNATDVTKIGKYAQDFILGTTDRGLMVMSLQAGALNTTLWSPRVVYNITGGLLQVKDFVVNEKTLYVINKGNGMDILDLNNNYNIYGSSNVNIVYVNGTNYTNTYTNFPHPSLQQLDFINNPFSGSKYLGVGVTNRNSVNEFFIEFLIDDEYNPLLNKVFTSGELVVYDSFYTVDKFFTYIFNKISNKLIILRRGMINTIPSELYYVDISKTILKESFVIGRNNYLKYIYDRASKSVHPMVLGESSLLIINNITFPDDTLTCRFEKNGVYNVTMALKGEVCKQSLDSDYLYTTCDKMINFTYYIYGDSSDEAVGIIVGVVVACCALLAIGIGIIIVKTKCFTQFDDFKLNTENVSSKREELYKSDGSLANNALEDLIDRKPSQYQLGTEIDGQVLGQVIPNSHRNSNSDDFANKENNLANVHGNLNNDNEYETLKRIELQKMKMKDNKNITDATNIKQASEKTDNYNIMSPQKSMPRSFFKKKNTKSADNEKIKLDAENILINKKDDADDNHSNKHKDNEHQSQNDPDKEKDANSEFNHLENKAEEESNLKDNIKNIPKRGESDKDFGVSDMNDNEEAKLRSPRDPSKDNQAI